VFVPEMGRWICGEDGGVAIQVKPANLGVIYVTG
jgi:hypothetical protein